MNKLKFVIDTNVLLSSILIASSKPDEAFKKARKLGKILVSEMTFADSELLTPNSELLTPNS